MVLSSSAAVRAVARIRSTACRSERGLFSSMMMMCVQAMTHLLSSFGTVVGLSSSFIVGRTGRESIVAHATDVGAGSESGRFVRGDSEAGKAFVRIRDDLGIDASSMKMVQDCSFDNARLDVSVLLASEAPIESTAVLWTELVVLVRSVAEVDARLSNMHLFEHGDIAVKR